jgi:hypothetical protein
MLLVSFITPSCALEGHFDHESDRIRRWVVSVQRSPAIS